MVFTVSVRDTRPLEGRLKKGKELDDILPEECKHNSKVIYEILGYVDRVLPEFKSVSDRERKIIADSVSYLMRTDIIIPARFAFGPTYLLDETINKVPAEEKAKLKIPISLKNDPEQLNPKWKLPDTDEYINKGAEFFRCYSGVMSWIRTLYDKLDPENHSLTPAFKMADVTAFLVNPDNLIDYSYTPEEIIKFHETLEREMSSV